MAEVIRGGVSDSRRGVSRIQGLAIRVAIRLSGCGKRGQVSGCLFACWVSVSVFLWKKPLGRWQQRAA